VTRGEGGHAPRFESARVSLLLNGEEEAAAPYVVVPVGRHTGVPAAAGELAVGCRKELGALVAVLADEDDQRLGRAALRQAAGG
jgi:hypothetical protein